jgi:hypothetical protein
MVRDGPVDRKQRPARVPHLLPKRSAPGHAARRRQRRLHRRADVSAWPSCDVVRTAPHRDMGRLDRCCLVQRRPTKHPVRELRRSRNYEGRRRARSETRGASPKRSASMCRERCLKADAEARPGSSTADGLSLEQPPLDRRDRGVRAVVDPKLVHGRGEMCFHRALADAQRGGDLLVLQPFAYEPQDGPLPVAQQ